jgi:hypothetical protein
MGYEIEMSLDLRKHRNVSSILDGAMEMANNNECQRYFQFSECEGEIRRLKRQSQIIVFCFDEEKFTKMSNFLKQVIDKYKKWLFIESIYEVEKHNLIYASPYYMTKMDTDKKDDYKHRRTTRAFSDTDYYILRDILKKNY